jgi:hypothetical protein
MLVGPQANPTATDPADPTVDATLPGQAPPQHSRQAAQSVAALSMAAVAPQVSESIIGVFSSVLRENPWLGVLLGAGLGFFLLVCSLRLFA